MGVKHDQPRWKVTKLDWSAISAMDDTTATAALRVLTSRQQSILLAFMEQLRWKTRWDNLSVSQSELNELEANLSDAIMADIDICTEIENCLPTSPTITAILAAIQALQDDIDAIVTIKTESRVSDCGLETRWINAVTDEVIADWQPVTGWDKLQACFAPDKTPIPPVKDDPDDPDANDKLCGAANYLALQISKILDEVIAVDALYEQAGDIQGALEYWLNNTSIDVDMSVLADLLEYMFLSTDSGLTDAMDYIEADIASLLFCNNLNQYSIDDWIKLYAPITTRERYIIGAVVQMLTPAYWQKLIYIGTTVQASTCSVCGSWCVEALDTLGIESWQRIAYSPVTCIGFYAADEIQSCTASGHRQWAAKLEIPVNNTINNIGCKVRANAGNAGNEYLYCDILDRDDVVVWSDEAVIIDALGYEQIITFSPQFELPAGGSIVLYVFAADTGYTYINLTNVQVQGLGIAPYTPNCVTSYTYEQPCASLPITETFNGATKRDCTTLVSGDYYNGVFAYDGSYCFGESVRRSGWVGGWVNIAVPSGTRNVNVSARAFVGGNLVNYTVQIYACNANDDVIGGQAWMFNDGNMPYQLWDDYAVAINTSEDIEYIRVRAGFSGGGIDNFVRGYIEDIVIS